MKKRALTVVLVFFFVTFSVFSGAQQEQAASDPSKPYEGVELNVITLEQAYAEGLKALVDEFEADTGIQVNIETMAQVQLIQKVGVELMSGSNAYDLLFIEGDALPRYAEGGLLVPIDDYVKDPDLADADLDIDDFIDSTLDACSYEGELFALPNFAACQLMYYRGDVLEELGYDAPPKTFEELMEMSEAITKTGMPAIAMRGQAGTHNIWVWSQFLYGMGGHFFKDYPNDLTPVINSPEAVKAVEVYAELMQEHSIPGAASADYDDVVIAMQQGRVAFAIEGGPLGGRILDPDQTKVEGKVGFAVSPGGPAGVYPPFTAQMLAINNASKNKEAAFEFLQWSTSKDIMKRISLDYMHIAVTRDSIWEDSDFLNTYDFDYGYGSFVKAYQDTLSVAPHWYRPAFELWEECRDRVGIAVQEVVVNKKTAQQALDDANEELTKILKRGGFL